MQQVSFAQKSVAMDPLDELDQSGNNNNINKKWIASIKKGGSRQNLTLSDLRDSDMRQCNNSFSSPSYGRNLPSPSTLQYLQWNASIPKSCPLYFGRFNGEEPFVALDCEMVGVGPGGRQSVLARVSIVDYNGNVLLDSYVRIEERVTDYRTNVSGVTMDHLRSSQAVGFGQVRSAVQRLLYRKILVGHGLENDLQVLRIHHPQSRIRDTSLYEPFMKVDYFDGSLRPRRLRDLTAQHLGQFIQRDGKSHDSIEDAKAAMELYKSVQGDWEYTIEWQRKNAHIPLYHRYPMRYEQAI